MDDKTSKKEYLHDLHERVRSHEMNRFAEDLFMVFRYRKQEKVNSQVDKQEHHQKDSCEGHDKLFGQ
jgi:hypothetical protein